MRSLIGALVRRQTLGSSSVTARLQSSGRVGASFANCGNENHRFCSSASNCPRCSKNHFLRAFHHFPSGSPRPSTSELKSGSLAKFGGSGISSSLNLSPWSVLGTSFPSRGISTAGSSDAPTSQDSSIPFDDVPPRIKFKRMDKTARNIMQILNREAVEEVRTQREVPDIRPGYIVQLKVEVPENKRRLSTVKGIVIARRNAGINTTFRIRRQVAGVGVESLFMLYSPNIKEVKILDKKKVRRAKLYYLREKMNALSK
ncbi:unnamed protein product [Linum tenue]|uniref:Ribosomal protein L19 n=1 Tax=Linum tenue TaxID=586396 RepID=A0AAV0MA30_9ROSI|nr:unnamed protein product [Linum tenue]